MFFRSAPIALAALAFVTATAAAQVAEPRFAGEWTLDVGNSSWSAGPLPKGSTWTVKFAADTMKMRREVVTDATTTINEIVVGFDGKPWSNALKLSGAEATMLATAKWDGRILVFSMAGNIMGTAIVQDERWVLSDDGKRVVASRTLTADGEDVGAGSWTYVRK